MIRPRIFVLTLQEMKTTSLGHRSRSHIVGAGAETGRMCLDDASQSWAELTGLNHSAYTSCGVTAFQRMVLGL